jgi:iron complex transport system substrate-binding protein
MTVKEKCACHEIRCKRCGRLLMKGFIKAIEVKCPKCGYVQIFSEMDENRKIS